MDKEKIEVIAPLFDRLTDQDPHTRTEAKVFKTYTLAETRLAVERDVADLLNTRYSQLPHSLRAFNLALDKSNDLADYPLLSYGLPDFSKYEVDKLAGQVSIEYDITHLIDQYEPRLRNTEVYLELSSSPRAQAVLYISAILTADPTEERFTFPVNVGSLAGD